jgi:hypothetical protein
MAKMTMAEMKAALDAAEARAEAAEAKAKNAGNGKALAFEWRQGKAGLCLRVSGGKVGFPVTHTAAKWGNVASEMPAIMAEVKRHREANG